ncbi:MAG: hypothetical protein ACRCW2_05685 [Cellulosilyticaceae bacterium]
MNKEYDLKKVIDQTLQQVKVDEALEETIKARCLKQRRGIGGQSSLMSKGLKQVALWVFVTITVLSGTAYALTHIGSINTFIDQTMLEQIAPHVQQINQMSQKGEIQMVVETAITDHYKSLLVFSFINEGEKPWEETIILGDWDESWTRGTGWAPPVVSEDGRKLTYCVRGYNTEDMLQNKTFELRASNLIQSYEVEEAVDIPLAELAGEEPLVLDTIDYDYPSNSKYLYMKLERLLRQKFGDSQRITLKENPKVSLMYVGMIQDSKLEDPMNPDGGLTVFTRNPSDKYWTDSDDDYMVGWVTEVMDTRTGERYESGLRAVNYDGPTLWKGGVGVSQFPELMDPSIIPYLKATKITYDVQEVVADQDWKVKFQVKDTTTVPTISTEIQITENGQQVQVSQVDCSVLGVALQGTYEGRAYSLDGVSITDDMNVNLKMKDGSILPLYQENMSTNRGGFLTYYMSMDENNQPLFIDMEQVQAILINEKEVMLP